MMTTGGWDTSSPALVIFFFLFAFTGFFYSDSIHVQVPHWCRDCLWVMFIFTCPVLISCKIQDTFWTFQGLGSCPAHWVGVGIFCCLNEGSGCEDWWPWRTMIPSRSKGRGRRRRQWDIGNANRDSRLLRSRAHVCFFNPFFSLLNDYWKLDYMIKKSFPQSLLFQVRMALRRPITSGKHQIT